MSDDGMQAAVRKADVLIEALPYIRAFRGKVVAVKMGGSAMEDPAKVHGVLEDVVFMASVGMRPVIIHGGGPAISDEMQRAGREPVWVHGHRVTDAETLEIVRRVLVDRINAGLVADLCELGAKAETVYGDPLLAERKRVVETDERGERREYDLGLVGTMTGADAAFFLRLLDEGIIPVVSPLARDREGALLNVNGDTVAAFLAGALAAEKLVFLSDTHGILLDPADEASFAETLDEPAVEQLVRDGVITGGMRPKAEACIAALKHGVRTAHIVDGRLPHSLLLEIFTRRGVGTQILNEKGGAG